MEMEYGPFGLANLAADIWRNFAAAWSAAAGGERLMWSLLIATVPAAAYALWFVSEQRNAHSFG